MNNRNQSVPVAASGTKVLIVGAGIGGLATAIALRQVGFQVEVYEDSPVLREIGAGITLWANATGVLGKLDLLEEALETSARLTTLKVKNAHGELLMQAKVERYSTPAICIHRADLIELLQRKCLSENIHLGKTFERFEQTNTHVTAFFADGTSASGDILIGADGINSRVRAQMKGDAKPSYRGYTIWRSTVELEANGLEANCTLETFGAGKRFGLVPMGKNRFYWYATGNQPEGVMIPPPERKTQLLEYFHGWHPPISQVIETTTEEILQNDCYDRPPQRGWSTGRVCLIGDAAHPTTPNMGQGGCMALEDAVVLTRCLQSANAPEAAFREFERRRFSRTKLINQRSLLFGRVGQWQNPLAVGLRNILSKYTPQKSLERGFDSVHNYQA
jgi:2-polyprenyl-6-methoxyphenol hydroxylase-like FAD-dependent oxidoreductase